MPSSAASTGCSCHQRLARYRAALATGTDPALMAGWTAEVTATRAAAAPRRRPGWQSGGVRPVRAAPDVQTGQKCTDRPGKTVGDHVRGLASEGAHEHLPHTLWRCQGGSNCAGTTDER